MPSRQVTAAKCIRHKSGTLFSSFFHSFRQNLKQSVLLTLLFGLLLGVLILDCSFFFGRSLIALYFFYFLILAVLGCAVYAFAWLSRFSMTTGGFLRMSLLLTFRHLPTTVLNLILLLPFLAAAGWALKNTLSDVSTLLMMAITTGELPKLDLVSAALPVAAAFFGLYLPLLPLRRWNTAAFAMRKPRVKTEKKASA